MHIQKALTKKKEVVSTLAKKYQLRIQVNKGRRPQRNLDEEQKQWLQKALDHPDLLMMNPAKRIMFMLGRLMEKGDTNKSGICCGR